MVKGISRQVIVVRSPDQKLFEQAIFILREEALGEGISDEAILRQAKLAAEGYLSAKTGRRKRPSGALCALAGSLFTGLIWAITLLF